MPKMPDRSLNSATPMSSTSSSRPDLLADHVRAIGQRTALRPFDELEHDLAAVEDRDRQQIEEAQRQRQQHQQHEEADRHPACAASPAYSAMEMTPDEILDGHVAGEHAHEELRLRDRHLPGLADRRAERARAARPAVCVRHLGWIGMLDDRRLRCAMRPMVLPPSIVAGDVDAARRDRSPPRRTATHDFLPGRALHVVGEAR